MKATATTLLVSAPAWLVVLLTGCASGVVVLTHPRTGQTVECKAQPGGDLISTQIDNCVKAYESSGYKITGDTR